TVFGPGADARAGADPRQRPQRLRTTWHRPSGAVAVHRIGGRELRVAVARPERRTDHPRPLAGRAVVAGVAVSRRRGTGEPDPRRPAGRHPAPTPLHRLPP